MTTTSVQLLAIYILTNVILFPRPKVYVVQLVLVFIAGSLRHNHCRVLPSLNAR
jgi:hypothetical protein